MMQDVYHIKQKKCVSYKLPRKLPSHIKKGNWANVHNKKEIKCNRNN